VFLIAMLVVLTSGCPQRPVAEPVDAPKEGGTLVVAVAGSPVSLDPHLQRDWISRQAIFYMYDTLVWIDENEEIQPALAESWEIAPDGLSITFRLRQDVKFHDGTPFNAEAVKFNYDRMLDPAFNSRNLATLKPIIASVEVVDEYTVRFNLKRIDVNFLGEASWSSKMVSPEAVRRLGADFAANPVGTGPFRFGAFVPDSHLEVVRNEEHWRGRPYLDGIRVRFMPEASARIIELEAGTVDVVYGIPAKDVARLEQAGIPIERRNVPGFQMLALNLARGPAAELAVRKAIARAIDRQVIVDQVLAGRAELSRAGVSQVSPFYHADVPMVEYKPSEAERLLDQAGWVRGADGIRRRGDAVLKVNVVTSEHEERVLISQIVQEQLGRIGFQAEVVTLEWGAYLAAMRAGEYDVSFWSLGGFAHRISDGSANMQSDAHWNVSQIIKQPALAEIARRIDQIIIGAGQTVDDRTRFDMLREFQVLSQEHQLKVWLWHAEGLNAIRPVVRDFRLYNYSLIWLDKAWLDR
jgi:peptide/nickel transport system substrate-binding protein